MKKKLPGLLLTGLMAFSLTACASGGAKSSAESTESSAQVAEASEMSSETSASEERENSGAAEEESSEAEAAEETSVSAKQESSEASSLSDTEAAVYCFGQTVTTSDGMFEFTPAFGGFAKEVGNWPDADFMTPAGQPSGGNPYKAADGNVMMYFSAAIDYVGASDQAIVFKYDFNVDYDDGNIFYFLDGNAWNSGKEYHSGCGIVDSSENIETGAWGYECSALINPVTSLTSRYVRFCIEVPEQLEENAGKSLVVVFSLNGEQFTFDARAGQSN